ncbi:ABC transporter permease subunit [Shewanella sp.]|uniref:ABC transporter permease subunit n=1 Tax=Shewanella sp. TaxID=50422 RepID=UPI003F4122E3
MTPNAPSTFNNMLLIAGFECRKFLFNLRGMIALIAFALVWGILLLYPIQGASTLLMQPSIKDLIDGLLGNQALNLLFDWPVAEMAIFWCFALYLFPMFSILIAADQFASDKTRGTLRFYTLRTSKDSLLFGRFLGQLLIQSILILLTIIATIALALSRDASLLLPAISSGALVGVNVLIVILPFTAVMTLLSLYANTARQAMVLATILWTIVSIALLILGNESRLFVGLQWLLPGAQLSNMINTNGLNSLAYAPIPLLQTAIALFLGRIYFQRSQL